jgi:tetratricopeptide (TPR) repeat protein
MKTFKTLGIILWALFHTSSLFAQNLSLNSGTTYAVVVGISDYENPEIPDLKFAHRDAEVFAEYLQSSAGGSLTEDQIMLLTNSEATFGNMYGAFDWLIESCNPGDRAIIYFSGHGDVETLTRRQKGFLLLHNSPSKVYAGGGAYRVSDIQEIIETISLDKETEVILITDACRAGNLAGSDIGGTQKTSNLLAQQASKEIKILSCQADEYSLEGEQWGGGRGAFSYHFIEGLYGLADNNNDLAINLMEIGRYIEDKVSAETAPQSQIPFTVGNRTTHLAYVDKELVKQIREQKDKTEPMLAEVESKGIEDKILATLDQPTRDQYIAFKAALINGDLMTPEDASANDLYISLIKKPKLTPLYSFMKRNLAAALLDESQTSLNKILANDPAELAKGFARGLYLHLPGYLGRAANLLGEKHYMYNRVIGMKYGFEAFNLMDQNHNSDVTIRQNRLAIPLAKRASKMMGEGALNCLLLQGLYLPINIDSSFYFYRKARQLSPTFASPDNSVGAMFMEMDKPKQAIKYYKKAIDIDSSYFGSYVNIGVVYNDIKKNSKKAEKWWLKSIDVYPNATAYSNLGNLYNDQERYIDAEAMCLKGIEVMPQNYYPYVELVSIYQKTQQDAKLSDILLKMEALAKERHGDYSEVAIGYLYLKDYDRFRKNYYRANGRNESLTPSFFYSVSSIYATQGKNEESLNWLNLTLERGYEDWDEMKADTDLDGIRETTRFQELMKEYKQELKFTCEDCLWQTFKKKNN